MKTTCLLSIPSKGTNPYPHLPHITITGNGVTKLLRQLNPHKASGRDSIPTRLLKEIADQAQKVFSTDWCFLSVYCQDVQVDTSFIMDHMGTATLESVAQNYF